MKLIKKHGLGGIAETVDSELDKLGSWGKLGVQIIDPTGVTGWHDFNNAVDAYKKDRTLATTLGLGIAALGAMPVIGGLGKLGKTSKAVSRGERVLNKQIKKQLTDITEPAARWMSDFTPEMKQEAVKILDDEILKLVDWCKSKNIKKLPKKLEGKVKNLTDKRDMILDNYDSSFDKIVKYINTELSI